MLISMVDGFSVSACSVSEIRRRALDDHPLLHHLWYGFDFFQHLRFTLRGDSMHSLKYVPVPQGLFMMMTNGFGAFLGSRISGM